MKARTRSKAAGGGDDNESAAAILALRDAERALASPEGAIRKQLRLLADLAPMREVSLWTAGDQGEARCVGSARGKPSKEVRAAARRALHGRDTPPGPRRRLVASALGAPEAVAGALAARVPSGRSRDALALFAEAAPLLACVLERRALLEARERQASLILTTERRLARFGLDLHDGPVQHVAALLGDLRLFERQLEAELAEHPHAAVLAGRAQDLELRTLALEGEIRELARTAGGPAVLEGSLILALRNEARAFAQKTGVAPTLAVRGPVDEATPSQRITLLRGVQESLRNTREHGRASSVSVVVEAPAGRLEARIEDDGRGFDLKRTLARARREGRLGLAGIGERARLLGGRCEIHTRPGGPTAVTISLPRWKPGRGPADAGEG